MKPVDVLCVGYACWDLNFHIAGQPGPDTKTVAESLVSEGGGPAANAAFCISQLGGHAAFAGRLGTDHFGTLHLKELEQAGVDTRGILLSDTPTPTSCILVNAEGQRSIVNYRPPSSSVKLNIGSMAPNCILVDAHELEAAEMALVQFPNVPSVLDAGSLRESTILLSKKVSHIIASSTFATELSESKNPEDGLRCLGDRAPFTAITQGDKGVLWKDDKGNSGHLRAPEVHAIDTTGAGDIFHGAFSLALSKGKSFQSSLSWANQVAAISVKKLGGRSSCPGIDEIPSLDRLA